MVRKIVPEVWSLSSVVTDHGQYELLSASLPAENSGQAGGWSSITFYYVIQLPGARDVSQPRGHGGGPEQVVGARLDQTNG